MIGCLKILKSIKIKWFHMNSHTWSYSFFKHEYLPFLKNFCLLRKYIFKNNDQIHYFDSKNPLL